MWCTVYTLLDFLVDKLQTNENLKSVHFSKSSRSAHGSKFKSVLASFLASEGNKIILVWMFFGLFLQVSEKVISLERSGRSFLGLIPLSESCRQQCILKTISFINIRSVIKIA